MSRNCSGDLQFCEKDPQDQLDYTFDFTALLEPSETIQTAVVTESPTGELTQEALDDTHGKEVVVVYSGGLPGKTYAIEVHVTTDEGGPPPREFNRTAFLPVKDL